MPRQRPPSFRDVTSLHEGSPSRAGTNVMSKVSVGRTGKIFHVKELMSLKMQRRESAVSSGKTINRLINESVKGQKKMRKSGLQSHGFYFVRGARAFILKPASLKVN